MVNLDRFSASISDCFSGNGLREIAYSRRSAKIWRLPIVDLPTFELASVRLKMSGSN